MAKIALQSELIASGDGWSVANVRCHAGPHDLPFEEQYARSVVAFVVEGTFQYRAPAGRKLMSPGSWLLGNQGEFYTCSHEHATGDRCVSFAYTPALLDLLEAAPRPRFRAPRLPPVRALAPLAAQVAALAEGADPAACEEIAVQVAARALELGHGEARREDPDTASVARVTRVVRMIENEPDAPQGLGDLARLARLSPYHFLRTFQGLIGATPHQYLLRLRLRRAAVCLLRKDTKILDIALGCGFGDVSNFNRTFRAEFGVSPRAYRSVQRIAK